MHFYAVVHPCYINLLPNWAWGVEEYSDNLELFASEFDMPFYSFDNYPVVEVDGSVQIRPDWYRNLEEFSAMARKHCKPFWGFALAKAHSISDPWPDTVYPEPTLGHLRLQVFSNLLYGAQAIQYFNFTGIVNPVTCERLPAFELVKQVNSEVRAYSPVFAGCSVLEAMPHKNVKSLQISGNGGVVALIENGDQAYLAIQNRDCINPAILKISFTGKTVRHTLHGELQHDSKPISLSPGNLAIFVLS